MCEIWYISRLKQENDKQLLRKCPYTVSKRIDNIFNHLYNWMFKAFYYLIGKSFSINVKYP